MISDKDWVPSTFSCMLGKYIWSFVIEKLETLRLLSLAIQKCQAFALKSSPGDKKLAEQLASLILIQLILLIISKAVQACILNDKTVNKY